MWCVDWHVGGMVRSGGGEAAGLIALVVFVGKVVRMLFRGSVGVYN